MFPIFDIHCHPSLKIYLCNKNINHLHYPLPDIIPSGMHVDLPGMRNADVKLIAANHYIPEAGFGHLSKSEWLFNFLKGLGLEIIDKFEPDDTSEAFNKTMLSMELLNHQVKRGEKEFNVVVPKNLTEFEDAFKNDKTIVLHCIEGAHHLGKNYADENIYTDNLNSFKKQGLCIFTISHFFQNALCDSGGGIPPKESNLIGYKKPASTCLGLTNTGKLVVEWCQDNGVIIDLVHSTIETRNQVYGILEKRIAAGKKIRPLIFSHSGIREVASVNMQNRDDQMVLPDIAELMRIKKYGGVLGLILMNYWIIGLEEDNPFKKDRGIIFLLQTIRFIHDKIGDYENISIGTDLDGFTQVPDDISHIRLIGRLRDAITNEFGEEASRKICYENALRVIRAGWA